MTDKPNIIGPVSGLIGLGVMAYAAKNIIDVLKEKAETEKQKKKMPGARDYTYREPQERQPKIESQNIIQRGLNKMLRG